MLALFFLFDRYVCYRYGLCCKKEREEEESKKEGDFFRRCRVRVIGLRSGKGSFAKRLILFFLVPEHLKKSFHQVFH